MTLLPVLMKCKVSFLNFGVEDIFMDRECFMIQAVIAI